MKEHIPELCKTYYFYMNGKSHPHKYIGTKGKYYVFEFYGKLIELTPARFNYLFNNCNMNGVEEKQPERQSKGLSRLFSRKKTDNNP